MIELKRVIVIDKMTNHGQNNPQSWDIDPAEGPPRRQSPEEHLAFVRAHSYREVMNTILHTSSAISLIVDRFRLTENDTELTLRQACRSVARVAPIPWVTAESWNTATQKFHFVHELGKLVEDHDFGGYIRQAVWSADTSSFANEVFASSISGLELLRLLQGLAATFSHSFCYVHTLHGEMRACLYFESNHLVHVLFYDALTYTLSGGHDAVHQFGSSIVKYARSRPKEEKFCFRTFTQSAAMKSVPLTVRLKPEDAFSTSVASLETKIHLRLRRCAET